MPSVIFIVRTA